MCPASEQSGLYSSFEPGGPQPCQQPPSITSHGLISRRSVSSVGASSRPKIQALPESLQTCHYVSAASCCQLFNNVFQPLTLEKSQLPCTQFRRCLLFRVLMQTADKRVLRPSELLYPQSLRISKPRSTGQPRPEGLQSASSCHLKSAGIFRHGCQGVFTTFTFHILFVLLLKQRFPVAPTTLDLCCVEAPVVHMHDLVLPSTSVSLFSVD